MITAYLSLYLLFVIVLTLTVSLVVLKFRQLSFRSVITFLIIFIAAPLILGYLYLIYVDSLPEMAVPDVAGLPFEEAREILEESGLRVRQAGSVYEMKYAQGQVVSQRPEAGRRVKAGRVINLMVSSGKRKVACPNLLGRTLFQAEATLSAAELRVGEIRREARPDLPEGTILAQEPLPGEEAEVGRGLDFIVSTTLEGGME